MERNEYPHDLERPYLSPLVLRGLKTFIEYVPEKHERTGFQRLCTKNFSIEETGFPVNKLKEWFDAEILWCSVIKEDGTLANCSLDDIVWMHIVEHLYSLGLSTEFIAKVAESGLDQLIAWKEDGEYVIYNVVDVYVWLALKQHIPTVFVVFETGFTDWFSFDEYVALWDIYKQNPPHHHVISLNRIGQQLKEKGLLSDYDPPVTHDTTAPLISEEMQVVQALREGNLQKLVIRIRDGKIHSMDGEEDVSGKQITDLLKDNKFQDIHLKQQDGKVVHAVRIIKKKLSEKTDWKNQR